MENEQILTTLEQWESNGEMTPEMAESIDKQFEAFVQREFNEIEERMDTQSPEYAYAKLTRLTSFINAAIAIRPAIIRKLEKWVQKLKSVVQALAKKLGANSFSISAGLPLGISISLSFPIT